MTEVLERLQAPEVPLNATGVHAAIQANLAGIDRDTETRLSIVHTELVEVTTPGIHRLVVLDETVQPTESFKYQGMAIAVHKLLDEYPRTTTFYSGTARNAGAAMARATLNRGCQSVLLAPQSLTSPKRNNMEKNGGKVRADYTDVMGAIAAAQALGEDDPNGIFLHPFDDLYALSGQGLVGRRIVEGLQALDIQGPVEVLGQRGGGSLLASLASVLKAANFANLKVREVRPARTEKGELDMRYDGLAVEKPGSYAATLLGDRSFVNGRRVIVSESDTGRAAWRIASSRPFLGRRFEPSGLAGVAAFVKLAKNNPVPTTYVAVLTGANVTPEAYADIAAAPRREQDRVLQGLGQNALTEHPPAPRSGSRVASSPTATFREAALRGLRSRS